MKTDDIVQVNGNGDLMLVRADGAWIGTRAKIVRQLKSGWWLVEVNGLQHKFPKRNLDLLAVAVEYPYTNPGQ